LGDLIQVIDPKGKIIYANNQWLERLGYSKYELSSLNFMDDILDESFWAIFLAESGNLDCVECTNKIRLGLNSRSGEQIIVEANLIPRTNHDGLQSIVCIFHEMHAWLHKSKQAFVSVVSFVHFDWHLDLFLIFQNYGLMCCTWSDNSHNIH
jgi:PAS domain S-box-containing protein